MFLKCVHNPNEAFEIKTILSFPTKEAFEIKRVCPLSYEQKPSARKSGLQLLWPKYCLRYEIVYIQFIFLSHIKMI